MKFKDTKYGDLTGQTYDGDINVYNMGLTSLEGAPEIVNGKFWCQHNKLTNLKGAPRIVKGWFNCRYNQLVSLEGSPEISEEDFCCSNNNLTNSKRCSKNC
jgi:hypothetical protein